MSFPTLSPRRSPIPVTFGSHPRMYHFRASHPYHIPPQPTARATGETDRHDDGFTVSREWWGNLVRVRCTEVVHILEEEERKKDNAHPPSISVEATRTGLIDNARAVKLTP